MSVASGKTIRLGRLLRGAGRRAACLALDHGLLVGPIPGAEDLRAGITLAVEAGFDAIILSVGAVARNADLLSGRQAPAVIMRIDQTTMWRIGKPGGYPEGYTRQVAAVEDAAVMGADAVLTYFFTGHADPSLENRSLEIAATTAQQARRHGIPFVAEPMAARGGLFATPFDQEPVAMNARMAVEFGADLIKTDWPGSTEACRAVIAGCADVPVLLAGGERTGSDEETLTLVAALLEGGANGVMFGRALFQAREPLRLMRIVREMIHDDLPLASAIRKLEDGRGAGQR